MVDDPAFPTRCRSLHTLQGAALEEGNDAPLTSHRSRKISLDKESGTVSFVRRSLQP